MHGRRPCVGSADLLLLASHGRRGHRRPAGLARRREVRRCRARALEDAVARGLVPAPDPSQWCAFDGRTGGLQNPASLAGVETHPAFAQTVTRAVRRFRSAFGDSALVSVVLTGSVARGAPVGGHSDVDLVAYVLEPENCDARGRRDIARKIAALAEWGASAEARGPARRAEMQVVCVQRRTPAGHVLQAAKGRGGLLPRPPWRRGGGVYPCRNAPWPWPSPLPGAFEAASTGCTVHGADICGALPPPTLADCVPRLLLGLPDLRERLAERGPQLKTREAWWLSRRLLRAGAELVAHCEGRMSRDVVLCYASMREHLKEWDEVGTYLPLLLLAHRPGASESDDPVDPAILMAILAAVDDLEDRFLDDYSTLCSGLWPARGREGEGPPRVARATASEEEVGAKEHLEVGGEEEVEEERRAARPLLEFPNSGIADGWQADSRETCSDVGLREMSSLNDEAAAAVADGRGPVVVRGGAGAAGLGWRCAPDLDMDALRDILGEGEAQVRVSRTLDFAFCEEGHPHVRKGLFTPPSRLVDVPASEFFRRTFGGDGRDPGPLAFAPRHAGDSEFLYMQTSLPRDASVCNAASLARLSAKAPSQGLRLWVSPAGAVSPTHWDASPSFLAQLLGRKKMRLWRPRDLVRLRPLPDGHPLRRRCRHDPRRHDGWVDDPAAVDVLLYPGDLLFFPPRWAHFTQALDASASATVRF